MRPRRAAVNLLLAMALAFTTQPSQSQTSVSLTEEIEWTWEVRPVHADPALPNVLLLGDSITRNYYPAVKRELSGAANVYLMATSASLGDPRLPAQIAEFHRMEAVKFSVVHFNNGMHGWAYTEAQYKDGFPGLLQALRADFPDAQLIWASTTPVRKDSDPGPTNPRVDARNAIAKAIMVANHIAIDDQHELMTHHNDTYQDDVHFNAAGADLQGMQAVGLIKSDLAKP